MKGSLVLISDVSTRNKDHGPGIFNSIYPLSGIHLNVLNSILTANFMYESGVFEKGLICVVLLLLLWFCSYTFKLKGFFLSSGIVYVILLSIHIILFIYLNRYAAIVFPSITFAFSFLAISAYRFFMSEKEKEEYLQKLLIEIPDYQRAKDDQDS